MISQLLTTEERTPAEITSAVEKFARRLANGTLAFVPLRPAAGAMPNNCISSVDDVIATNGGKRIMGWKIWEGRFWFKAVYHAVWQSPEGEIVDVTPEPGETQTLFVVDPRTYATVYLQARVTEKKPRYRKVVEALRKMEAVQLKMNERINRGGTVPLLGIVKRDERLELLAAVTRFNQLLAEAAGGKTG